jgi:hypothetical protein
MPPFVLDVEALTQARAVGGDLLDADRQTQTGTNIPFYSVVGRNSKDASYRGEMNGKSVEVSRAGEFRRKNAEGEPEYWDALPSMAIVDARMSKTLFENDKPACKGISTKGFFDPVSIDPNGKMGAGFNCNQCPYDRWNWERTGGKEGKVYSPDGKVITQADQCKSSLQLWCYDLALDEYCIVQFSAGALRHYREFVKSVESQGVKMHSICWAIATEAHDNGASVAPTYAPALNYLRVLNPDEFKKVDEKRAELVQKALDAGSHQPALADVTRYNSLDEAIAAQQKALPALSAPPLITRGPAVHDPDDVFAGM